MVLHFRVRESSTVPSFLILKRIQFILNSLFCLFVVSILVGVFFLSVLMTPTKFGTTNDSYFHMPALHFTIYTMYHQRLKFWDRMQGYLDQIVMLAFMAKAIMKMIDININVDNDLESSMPSTGEWLKGIGKIEDSIQLRKVDGGRDYLDFLKDFVVKCDKANK